jgi:N-formylglutamate deformylase
VTDRFFFERGDSPLLISIPHDGRDLASGMEDRMTNVGRSLPDTDWYVRRLYEFAGELGASVLAARFSRYVVDLNRPASDVPLYKGQLSTGLCPANTFSGQAIYADGEECTALEQKERAELYWQPYHDCLGAELARTREHFGYALLWDAHSIRSEAPSLFGGLLPELNLGTNDGVSCDPQILHAVYEAAESSNYTVVENDRFKGGHITRNYGSPEKNVHAIQLELAQRAYMDEQTVHYEEEAAVRLRDVLRTMLKVFIANAG